MRVGSSSNYLPTSLFATSICLVLLAEGVLGDLILRNRHIHLQVVVVVVAIGPRHILEVFHVALWIVGGDMVGHKARLLHIGTQTPLAVELATTFGVDSHLPYGRLEALLGSILGVVVLGWHDSGDIATEWDRILGTVDIEDTTIGIRAILAASPAGERVVIGHILVGEFLLVAILQLAECTVAELVELSPALSLVAIAEAALGILRNFQW